MQQERWERLERLFAQALALPKAKRAAWLANACSDDEALRREIEELVRAHAVDGVLDTPVLAGDAIEIESIAPSLAAGTRIGVWRLEKLVGRGGMGEVYAATRAEAGFAQRGALKLLRFEAIGELARFHAERQILARLDHPGIARLLDGGVAPDGRPYTVMEFVEGASLVEYCGARRAPLHERLDLFVQVCDAVAYAHRNLIIHRDLKPANTLVNAAGKVKLLDFGIAKLIDANASSSTADPTLTIAPFTLDYAAPEQLAGEPVTTATDVYALGLLLFELLTGERPLRTRGLLPAQALALLNDREAPSASRTVRDKADAPLPASALAGDLDAIVAKCLRREPAHRYATVNDLKLDLQRHLAREPVLAREGARLYVFGRVLRRYRWVVAAAAALVLALAAGLAGTLWQARRAEIQARLTAEQLSRAEATKKFLLEMFEASDPRRASDTPRGTITARELLDAAAPHIERDFAAQPELQIELLGTVANIFHELLEPERYETLHGRYMELALRQFGERDPRVIDGYLQDAEFASEREDSAKTARLLDQVDPLIRQAGLDRSAARARWWMIKSNMLFQDTEHQAERESLLLNAVDLYEHTNPADEEYVNALLRLGNFYSSRGDYTRAHEFHLRAETTFARLPQRDDAELAIIELNLAVEAGVLGNFAEADASFERAANLYLQTYGERHYWYWITLADWGIAVCRNGDHERAERLFARLLPILPADPKGEDVYYVARTRELHGTCLADQGRERDAIPLLEAVERQYVGDNVALPGARLALGDAYDRAGRVADARRALKQALDDRVEQATKAKTLDNAKLLGIRERWGRFLLDQGETGEAERQFREVIAQDHKRNLSAAALAYGGLARLAWLGGDPSSGVHASIESLRVLGNVSGERDARTEPYLWRIHAQALARAGEVNAAHDYAQRSLDAFRRYDDPASAQIAKSAAVLVEIDRAAKN